MLGINIGSQNTIFSTCGKDTNGKFTTQTLLTDTSDRTLPSNISFTQKDRKVGVIAEGDIKKNPESSFLYVQRYIGLIPNTPFFEKEIKYSISPNFDESQGKFVFEFGGKNYSLIGDDIVAGFIDKVFENYDKNNENINYDEVTISIPDFFTPLQRDSIYLILKSNGIKIPHIINE
jgi:molecular chaperone DnaK (HSP70)